MVLFYKYTEISFLQNPMYVCTVYVKTFEEENLCSFRRILAKHECFTIETFPASQLENNYRSQ